MSQLLARRAKLPGLSRLGWLMALYAENHARLVRLFEPGDLAPGIYVSSVGDGLDLRLDVIERHAYTSELRLAYVALPDPVVSERWIGTYASAPDRLMLVDRPAADVRIVVITSGTGASTSFAIAEEVTLKGNHERRPDLVLYVNGIAVGVIELKNSRASIGDGIRQCLSNQQADFNAWFFTTVQLLFAGNDSEGLRYGTIGTEEKYFLKWKEDEADDSRFKLDKYLLRMCRKDRLLELMHEHGVETRHDIERLIQELEAELDDEDPRGPKV